MELGKWNNVTVLRETPHGFFLGDDEGNDVLMPYKWAPQGTRVDDRFRVFIHNDSEGRIIATLDAPKITLDEFAVLEIKDVSTIGAFADWGLEKDLLIPYREQVREPKVGEKWLVYLYLDESTNRLVGTTKTKKYLLNDEHEYFEGQEVELLIARRAELGYYAIINQECEGLIYQDEIYKDIRVGDTVKGYIKFCRADGKIDLSLQQGGYKQAEDSTQELLAALKANDGVLYLTDKSAPEDIKAKLGMSKKAFKKALGALYKQRFVKLHADKTQLLVKIKPNRE
jgi:predicted RNA-binding protein (virulence factor B family)